MSEYYECWGCNGRFVDRVMVDDHAQHCGYRYRLVPGVLPRFGSEYYICDHCQEVFPSELKERTGKYIISHRCPDGMIVDRFKQIDPELVRAEAADLEAAIRSMMKIEDTTSEATSSRKSWLRRVFKS